MATRTTTKKAELKTSTAKPATEKETPAKKTTTAKAAVKATVKKATTRKTTVRKTASKKAVSLNTEVYVQWLGKEVSEKDIVDSIKKVWTEEMGKKEADLMPFPFADQATNIGGKIKADSGLKRRTLSKKQNAPIST